MTLDSLTQATASRTPKIDRREMRDGRATSSSTPAPLAKTVTLGTASGQFSTALLATADVVAIFSATAISWLIATKISVVVAELSTLQSLRLAAVLIAGHLTLALYGGLYAAIPLAPARELRQWFFVSAMLLLGVAALAALGVFPVPVIGWLMLGIGLVAIFAPIARTIVRLTLGKSRWWGRRVVIVGGGELAARTLHRLLSKPQLGLRPIGFVDDQSTSSSAIDPALYLGTYSELAEIASTHGTSTAVIASDAFDADEMCQLVSRTPCGIRHWLVLPLHDHLPSLWTSAVDVGGRPALSVSNLLASPWRRAVKRSFDLVVTLLGLALIWPLLLALALLVKFSSRGPVFYSQERVGYGGSRFRAWKFRSMHLDAEELLKRHLAADPALREEWEATHKLKHDPRVTWIGRIMRRTSLDELPQVFNVLIGEMSLVGPRPIVEAEIVKYGDRYGSYQQVVPGISGLWQVSGRNNTTYRERVELDEFYVNNWSPWLDLYILACTVKVVLLGEGAY